MGMCDNGKTIARRAIAIIDETAGVAPDDQTDAQKREGVAAMEALEDHGYECKQCAPVVAAAFTEGLRAAVNE